MKLGSDGVSEEGGLKASHSYVKLSNGADDVRSVGSVPQSEWTGMVLLLKLLFFLDSLGGSTWGRFAAIYYNQPSKVSSTLHTPFTLLALPLLPGGDIRALKDVSYATGSFSLSKLNIASKESVLG